MTTRTPPRSRPPRNSPPRSARNRKQRSIVDRRQTPWAVIVTVAGVVVLAATVTTAVVLTRHGSSSHSTAQEIMPAAVAGSVTHERAPQRVADASGIPGVLAWNTRGWPGDGSTPVGSVQHQHVAGPVVYTELPPIGGPHNGTWLNAGIYDKPVPNERAVHDMEHGAVWITYRPNLPATEVTALRAFVGKQSELSEQTQSGTSQTRYVVMSPWANAGLPSPIVISSWGHQLRVSSADDSRLQRFVDTFRSSATYTPEHGEPVDGVPVSVGGRPLST